MHTTNVDVLVVVEVFSGRIAMNFQTSLMDSRISPAVFVFFVVLYFLQRRRLRPIMLPTARHTILNLMVAIPSGIILRLAILPAGLFVAGWSERSDFGILHWIRLPVWIEMMIGFLLLDLTFYYWHILNHKLPFFWRFHNVHHIDLDLDVSTAFRFHFMEMFFSIGFRSLQVALLGVTPLLFLIFEGVFQAATEFHHSNWRLPFQIERLLVMVIVTPRMHGIHHSIVQNETDSNFSTILSFWDRLHRTIRLNISQQAITIGVPAYLDPSYQRLLVLLWLPFRKQKEYWLREDGTRPARLEISDKSRQILVA